MGRDGSRIVVPEDHEEEEDEGDNEPDGEEVCEDEVFEGESPARFAGELGFGVI